MSARTVLHRRSGLRAIPVVAALCLTGAAVAGAATVGRAGPHPDGTAITPSGYRITPSGRQTPLGLLPLSLVASPDRRTLLVANAGQGTQSLQVVDARTARIRQTISYAAPEALFAGLAFGPDGRRAYASGGGNNKIRTYDVADGRLTETAPIPLPTTDPAGGRSNPFPAGTAVSPDGRRLYVAASLADAVLTVDLATKAVTTTPVGRRPYAVALTADGQTGYVTNQGGTTVTALDLRAGNPLARATIPVGTHPNAAALDPRGQLLYVTNGDSDTVSVIDTRTSRVSRTLDLSPYPGARVGSTPLGLDLDADARTLYVANAGNNDVAVVDLATGRVTGMIPTGWYPSAVLVIAGRLFVTNAKGLGAGPNDGPNFPNPERAAPTAPEEFVGSMMVGSLSTLDLPRSRAALDRYSRQVVANDGFDERDRLRTAPASAVVPRRVGEQSPIKHVIYVVKENRTFDQVLGSLGKGEGDRRLTLFGDDSAPNTRELARRFTTLDNFYADAEISAQGWNWTVAANSNPFTEQRWPANYSNRNHPYPSESAAPETVPNRNDDDAYVWQRLARAGASFRNYGFYVDTDAAGRASAAEPTLAAATDPAYRGYDLSCPDSSGTFASRNPTCGPGRVDEWLREFRQYQTAGNLPTVQFVRLPNDHTAGTRAGSPTPKAYVADNDYALGRLVDAVSHSRFWDSTAIFVTEDDAQNGPDHVDAHRTVALVISPFTQTGRVDSTFYDTASMLRTIELIVGLGPLTQFDSFATPMGPSFTDQPNPAPYSGIKPTTDLTAVNGASAPLAAASAAQNLAAEDRIDEQSFNEAIWKSVRGANSPMPTPRHALRTVSPASDDDD